MGLLSGMNEQDMESLKSYNLNTEQDEIFDGIAQLAAEICETEGAGIVFIDNKKAWAKSLFGLENSELDYEVFSKNSENKEYYIVEGKDGYYYSLFPLLNPQGFILGNLFLVCSSEMNLSEKKIRQAKMLVKQILSHLESRKATNLLKVTEEKVIESARMASVGLMAAGISHEINNPLSLITGNINILRMKLEDGLSSTEELLEYCDKLELNATRISKIIKSMRTFYGKGDNDPVKVQDVSTAIHNVVSFMEDSLNRKEIEIQLEEQIDCIVKVSETQLSQVLSNLVSNAIGAIKDLEEKWIKIESSIVDGEVEIAVSDSGNGISEECQAKLFVPFFTTKDVGSGTGLGLSISKGLIEKNGGRIYYDKTSKNTKFIVRIPLYNEKQQVA